MSIYYLKVTDWRFNVKQGFHVARAEAPLRERDLASELGIAKMHNRQMFEYYCTLKQLATLVRENLQDNVYI